MPPLGTFASCTTWAETEHELQNRIDKANNIDEAQKHQTAHVPGRMLRQAVRILAEVRVARVLAEHDVRGIPVSEQDLLRYLETNWPNDFRTMLSSELGPLQTDRKKLKEWCRQFRAFWHVRFGRLPVRSCLPPDLLHERAGTKHGQFLANF